MSGYQVDPAALLAASGQFEKQYAALVKAITDFQSHSLNIDGAFGWLGPSTSVLKQYENTTESAFKGLDQLAKLLNNASGALQQTATNYSAADAVSTMQGK